MKKINNYLYKEGSYQMQLYSTSLFDWEWIVYRKDKLLASGWSYFRFTALMAAHRELRRVVEEGIVK